jgi:hypothetical protein
MSTKKIGLDTATLASGFGLLAAVPASSIGILAH